MAIFALHVIGARPGVCVRGRNDIDAGGMWRGMRKLTQSEFSHQQQDDEATMNEVAAHERRLAVVPRRGNRGR